MKQEVKELYFSFTYGLDEQIRLTKSWQETILNDKKLSFHFVFIKSSELDSKDAEYLQSVWNDFEGKPKKNGAKSLVRVNPIDTKLTLFNNFVDSFVDVMKRINKKSIKNPDTFNENETPRIDHTGSSICRLDDIKK